MLHFLLGFGSGLLVAAVVLVLFVLALFSPNLWSRFK